MAAESLWKGRQKSQGKLYNNISCTFLDPMPSWLLNTLLKTCLSMEPPTPSQGQPSAGTGCSQIKEKSGVFHQKVQF